MLLVLLFGLLLGFFGSIPLAGPIALLIFKRGLEGRYRSGLSLAVGAAIPESLFAFLAYFGVSVLLKGHPVVALASRALVALLLLGLGLAFAVRPPRAESSPAGAPEPKRSGSDFALGFTITLLNPTFLATWTAAVAAVHALGVLPLDRSGALPFALGVGTGIVGWFWLLLQALRRYKVRFRPETLQRVLRLVGLVLLGMGLWFGAGFVRELLGG